MGYGVLALLVFAPLVARLTTRVLADDSIFSAGTSDAYTSLWTYWWTQKALLTEASLFHCTWVFPPHGADLTFQATSVVPALLTVPLAQILGTVGGYNLMIVLFIALGAWAYYLFLRRTWGVAPLAAFLTGLLFGFCPYFVVKAHAHVNLINAWVWGGTLALFLDCYLRNRFSTLR